MQPSIVLGVLTFVSAVFAATHQVTVGANGLVFSPSNITAVTGDDVVFEFHPKNHTVTQSSFAHPCTFLTTPATGVDSGFRAVAANATSFPTWTITVANASAPMWFFCAQAGHCQGGMVFAINAPVDKSFAQFQANAKAAATSSGAPSATATSAGSSGSSPAASGSASGSAAATSSTARTNGALRSGGSAAGVLAVVGLLAGLVL